MIVYTLILLFATGFVLSSSEEIDKLRTTWRIAGEERNDISSDIWRLKEEIKGDKEMAGYLSGLKGQLVALKKEQQEFLASHEAVPKEKADILKEFEAVEKEAYEKLKLMKSRLVQEEKSMERLWIEDAFIVAFDYILSNSLLTPAPRFPSVYDLDEKLIKKAMDKRSELMKIEKTIMTKKTAKLKTINDNVAKIADTLGRFDLLEAAHFKLEMLKSRLKGVEIDEEKITKLLGHVETFEKSQSDAIATVEKKNWNDSITRLKHYSDLMFFTVPGVEGGGQWRLRLGPIKERSALDTKKLDISPLVNEAIASNSKLSSESKKNREEFIKQIKSNDGEKMKFVKMIGSNEIYEFMMKKCVKVVEGIHKYLVERGEEGPLGLYEEAISDLIPKDDLKEIKTI